MLKDLNDSISYLKQKSLQFLKIYLSPLNEALLK